MRALLTRVIAFFFIVLLPIQGYAIEEDKLYQASVVVPNAGQVAFREGAQEALLRVLVRVSGRNDIATVAPLMQEAAYGYKWVRQFSYKPYQPKTEDGNEKPEQQELQIIFNSGQVDGLLQKYQQPIWPAKRPQVVLWLVIDKGLDKRLLDATLDQELFQSIKDAAHRRGLPVILPQLSLSDVVPFTAIKSGNEQAILKASSDYNADYIIAGYVNVTSQQRWLGRWFTFYQGGTSQSLIDTYQPPSAVNEVIDAVADQLSEQFSIWPGKHAEEGLFIKVSGIQTFSQYHQLVSYLEALKVTNHLKVIEVNHNEVTLVVKLLTDQVQFFDVVNLDKLLHLQSQPQIQSVVRLGEQTEKSQQRVPIYSFIWRQSSTEKEKEKK